MAQNPFNRYAYSPIDKYEHDPAVVVVDEGNPLVVFSGGDLQAYINNIKVGNLESVTWSISVEVVGNYVMGRRDAVLYTTGKRVVVGSLVLSQYDRHALLEQVFEITRRKITHIASMWGPEFGKSGEGQIPSNITVNASAVNVDPGYLQFKDNQTEGPVLIGGLTQLRGLTRTQFQEQLDGLTRETAMMVGAQKFSYSDQLPPFDLTLVGVTKSGNAARCSIFGLQVTQETAGFSQNDLGNSVGMSFVALAVSPWRPVELKATV